MSDAALRIVRLLHLASPVLPVGAYTYSQGLEQAIDAGTVRDEPAAARWIGDAMRWSVARWELPHVAAVIDAWTHGDDGAIVRLDDAFVASRETAELRAETLQMGHSMARLLRELPAFAAVDGAVARLAALREPAYPTTWAIAAAAWRLDAASAPVAYLWSWLENQVLVAIKTVPLGQSAGQRLLATLGAAVPALAVEAAAREADAYENFTPALAIASAAHETQYSRLFRS